MNNHSLFTIFTYAQTQGHIKEKAWVARDSPEKKRKAVQVQHLETSRMLFTNLFRKV